MTTAGLLLMVASVGSVTLAFAWCLSRVLRTHRAPNELAKVEPVSEAQIDKR